MALGHTLADPASVESWLGGGGDDSLVTISGRDIRIPGFSDHELFVMRVATVAVSAVSIAATTLATFWFVRMRRSFRHDLIILLIQSDLLKALWFFILAAVELVRGTIASGSPVCQASGFFLALGFEACDISVLLVALHTALYIFRRGSGLYPYRYAAYGTFVLVPLLLASLAFINSPAYANAGYYCYLPASPGWTRRALSWGPRYFIICTICVAYLSTYIYVNFLMKRFSRAEVAGRDPTSITTYPGPPRQPSLSVPATPPIAYHGLIPPTPPSENGPANRRDRRQSSRLRPASVHAMEEQRALAPVPEHPIQWRMPNFSMDASQPTTLPQQQDGYFSQPNVESSQSTLHEQPGSRRGSTPHDVPSTPLRSKSSASQHLWSRWLAGRAGSSASHTGTYRSPHSSVSSASVSVSAPTLDDATGLAKMRDKTRRKMRQLFIYPTVYIFAWFLPFVLHVMPDDRTPYGLVVASLITLCLQGIVDSVVFCILEKPWRHPRYSNGSYGIFSCVGTWPGRGSAVGATTNVGRTREEMMVDSRIACKRRDEELAARRLPQLPPHAARREWWDVALEESGLKASDDEGISG